MITRKIGAELVRRLGTFPVVALVGARQTGKTTLARGIAARCDRAIYLDLERPRDLAKLSDAEIFLERHAGDLVVLDEIQRAPELFPLLRSLVDADRRPGRFLVLGSASPDLLAQASESLAGRVVYLELGPIGLDELPDAGGGFPRLWERGGFPNSLLAASEEDSFEWREAFVSTFLERDIRLFGFRTPTPVLRRFWQMLAHVHGQLWNASGLAGSLGNSAPAVTRYLDLLERTFMVRRLTPLLPNLGKRLVKSPKIYLRDSGLLHALLDIRTGDDLAGHPIAGPSFEGFAIEQILSLAPRGWRPFFYRTAAGAELDLVLERPKTRPPVAIEIKCSSTPAVTRGFWEALSDLGCAEGHVVARVDRPYPLARNATAWPVTAIPTLLETVA